MTVRSEMRVSQAQQRRGVAGLWRRFMAAQDGSLTILALCLFMLMVMMGGLAVDLMRYEATRTTLQNTLDRATLASASLTQTLDAQVVVNDYFTKAGMQQHLDGVIVTEGLNFRNVVADASAATEPYFLHLIGQNGLDANGHSMAEQRVTNVEIALVLDVSGSMSGTKLTNLKKAAKEFVDTVLSSDPENRISITLVPYNAQVNLGADLRQKYNATHIHNVANVNCLELPGASYNQEGVSRTTPLAMSAFADWSSSTDKTTAYVAYDDSSKGKMNSSAPFCRNTAANIIRLPANDAATLKTQIDGLVAAGNTSIMLGMKWGLALLDPYAQPMFEQLAAAGKIPTYFDNRPFDWVDRNSMKLIVLMTDGEHVAHTIIPDDYKTGPSPIYRSISDGKYSIHFTTGRPAIASTNEYWVPHLNGWRAAPYPNLAGTRVQNWEDMWAVTRQSWVAWQLYARALGTSSGTRNTFYTAQMDAFQSPSDSAAAMDIQLQQSCGQAKANGVVVYGIAFEAPTNGQTQIRNCATSAAHYFNATGLQIQSAFRAIASNISQLRLTQ